MFHTQTCLNCKEPLQGRADKKFCSDQCRATYNNSNKKPHEEAIKKLNSQLRKNRTILKTLCPTGKATVRKEVLEGMNFSFRHFTSMYGQPGKVYFLCYDYAFCPIIEKSLSEGEQVKKVLIVQYQSFMKDFDPWIFIL
jgi:predicted nucleic acid-binding Zn ribbon protein